MRDTDQLMTKLRLRKLMEEMLDGDLIQVDVEEDVEAPGDQSPLPMKRISLVARFIPA